MAGDHDFLSGVLTPQDFAHYQRFLGDALKIELIPQDGEDWQWRATVITPQRPEREAGEGASSGISGAFMTSAQLEITAGYRRYAGELSRLGYGPDRCSSDTRLARYPGICWDVCGYYRRLRVHWRATRRELREAYLALGAALDGPGSSDLAYALSQLLNPAVRREYDAMPLGGIFLKDRDVIAELKRRAHRAASAMSAAGFGRVGAEDILGGWGFRLGPEPPDPAGPGAPAGDGTGSPELPDRSGFLPVWGHQWSWYAEAEAIASPGWRARTHYLELWQQMLVRAFAARGMRMEFGVGLCVRERFSIRPSYNTGTLVILLGPGEPTQQMADEAAEEWGFPGQPDSQIARKPRYA